MTRLALVALLFGIGTLAACEGGKGGRFPDADVGAIDGSIIEEGITPAPRGGGFCCPIDPQTCNCFRNGGWIEQETDLCPAICDLAPVNTSITIEEHGCEVLSGPESCLAPPPDAAVP